MSKLVPPHGKEKKLKPLLLEGKELEAEKEKAKKLKQVPMTSREASDVLMLGIGAFTPLEGFMGIAVLAGGGAVLGAILGALFPQVFGFVFEMFMDL